MRFTLRGFTKWPGLLLALLLAWSGAGHVQAQVYYLDLDRQVLSRPSPVIYYLDLSKQAVDLPNRTIYIEQVVDGRLKRIGIGTVHRGAYNTPSGSTCGPTCHRPSPPGSRPSRPSAPPTTPCCCWCESWR